MDFTIPIIFAIILLGAFAGALTELFKRIIKKFAPKFYKNKMYEIIKLVMPLFVCLIVAILTPAFIFGLVGIENINISSKIWLGALSGLLSNITYAVFKKLLKGIGVNLSAKDRPDKSDEEEPAWKDEEYGFGA